ncbi:hypothetical protein, variant 1 [Aphanomyces astaci]|uniref:Cleavage/polyadenylation specificity factor A subunit N-terminal domain-containing protein n=1 Tax=Aphanomyces astaci TaxID=112090 RepID=W4GXD2_APHAT|nr:hypothetical protein, variant 1 [Aphanomyces astaci]ETV83996.1 hypothetical protein, variant 1 [Aphanomyces astaci]|eukprot:XP_009825688.1 hypothetical protein, variant 1 [Aphanomyces astaci]
MGYGQTWLFRYPAPLHDAAVGVEREYSRQPSYYDMDDMTDEEHTNTVAAVINRDKDVAAFSMTSIAHDRILVTTPWTVCELQYRNDDDQFHFSPLGLTKESTPTALDYAMSNATMPADSSLLACDVLHLWSSRSALVLLYQEPRGGRCWLTLQPFSTATPPDQSSTQILRQRFEQTSVPLKSVTVTVRNGQGRHFHGVLLFRTDSVVACGYIQDTNDSNHVQAEQLSTDAFASFFPHLVDCHGVTAYHTTTATSPASDTNETPTTIRFLALGCANGVLRVMAGPAAVDGFEAVACTKQFELDGPISSLHLFNVADTIDRSPYTCDVVVNSSIGYAVVYHHPFDVACRPIILPESDHYDSLLCCVSADIDMDGRPELLLGTFSNALIAYASPDTPSGTWSVLPKPAWDFFFFGPVYSILCQDMNGDGVDELVIASTDGIHVLEPDCDQVLEKLKAVLVALQQQDQ